MKYGVYLHIPFCRQKCFYCDFPSWAGREKMMARYLRALRQEIRAQGALFVPKYGPPATIYLGGGTPTALPQPLMEELLSEIRRAFLPEAATPEKAEGKKSAVPRPLLPTPLGEVPARAEGARWQEVRAASSAPSDLASARPPSPRGKAARMEQERETSSALQPHSFGETAVEFTVEANPGTVDAAYLAMLHAAGVNRLSFGVQSFDDRLLQKIGRIHTGAEARAAVLLARAAGFENISLDLMYGLPGQTLEDLQQSVETALSLCPQHISIYGLQLEAGTAFQKMQDMGRLTLPSDEETEDMYDYMTTALPVAGYARYEISNFAKKGYESRHNLSYWQDVPYLGLGAAAHSYFGGQRYENVADIEKYCAAIEQGDSPSREEEPATRTIQMEEFAFLALRTASGIDKKKFQEKFGVPLEEIYAPSIEKMKKQRLLAESASHVFLTELGMKYGNWVFEAFLLT